MKELHKAIPGQTTLTAKMYNDVVEAIGQLRRIRVGPGLVMTETSSGITLGLSKKGFIDAETPAPVIDVTGINGITVAPTTGNVIVDGAGKVDLTGETSNPTLWGGATTTWFSDGGVTQKAQIDGTTGNMTVYDGGVYTWYSDQGLTQKAQVNGATGAMQGVSLLLTGNFACGGIATVDVLNVGDNLSIVNGFDLIGYSDGAVTEKFRVDMATGNLTTSGTVDGVDIQNHSGRHELGGADDIKLDDLATPDDNADLDVSIVRHGLAPKAPNDVTKFLRGDATWNVPPGSGVRIPSSAGYVLKSGANLILSYDKGDKIYIYDGAAWAARTFDPTVGKSTINATAGAANTTYYLYAFWNGADVKLELSAVVWARLNGVKIKNADNTRTLVAICRSDGANVIQDAVGQRFINNVYNGRWKQMYAQEANNSWAYGVAAYRPLNNSTANRVEFVADGENLINVRVAVWTFTATAQAGYVGIGLDSVVANHAIEMAPGCSTAQPTGTAEAQYKSIVAEGYHYLQALEYASGANVTFYGDSGVPAIWQEALMGEILC